MSDAGDEAEEERVAPPKEILKAEINTQYNLPVRAEKFSFGLSFTPPEGQALDIDLSCVAYSTSGKVLDAAYYCNCSALGGAMRHCGDNTVGSPSPGEDSEVIHVIPALVPEDCCLLMFTVSGVGLPSCSPLTLTTYAKEKKKAKEAIVQCDLAGESLGGTACQVSLAVYRTGNGWIAYHPIANTEGGESNWGEVIPFMKGIARQIPSLEEATSFVPDPAEAIVLPPKQVERAIDTAATFNPLADPVTVAEAASWPIAQAAAAEDSSLKRVRLDVGWQLWLAEPEGMDMQYQVVFSAANGEVVECGEEQGVIQGIRGAPEEEEEEPAEDEEAGKANDEVHPVPKGQDTDQHGFPLKDSFYVTLSQLPAKVKTMTVQVTNFGGSGMAHVKSFHVRVVDATHEDPNAHRDLFVNALMSPKGSHGNRTVAVLAKIFKEYQGTAYWQLREGGALPLAEYIDNEDGVRDILKAVQSEYCSQLDAEKALADALEAEESGEEGMVKPVLKPSAWRVRGLMLLEKAADAETYAEEAKRAAAYEGTYNGMGRRECALAKVVYENQDLYVGSYEDDLRSGKGMYVFANKGAYAGGYQGGLRHGHGVMVLPNGGCYVGAFEKDRFHGPGTHEYPDKSCYIGDWADGKKHGGGTYWDKHGGCMAGSWEKGVLKGSAVYQQAGYKLAASYTKGIPDGDCAFTIAAFRKIHAREICCAHITAPSGPVLNHGGTYSIPPGAADDPALDEDGVPVEDDSKPKMPAFPKYTGLTYVAGHGSPASEENLSYPPTDAPLPPAACVVPPKFDMATGLVQAV